MKSDEITARLAIQSLVASYSHFADVVDANNITALFTEDALFVPTPGPELHGKSQILSFFKELQGRTPCLRHHIATHKIDYLAPGSAQGKLYFSTLVEGVGLDHWGSYTDRYVLQDQGWLFASRIVTLDDFITGGFIAAHVKALKEHKV